MATTMPIDATVRLDGHGRVRVQATAVLALHHGADVLGGEYRTYAVHCDGGPPGDPVRVLHGYVCRLPTGRRSWLWLAVDNAGRPIPDLA